MVTEEEKRRSNLRTNIDEYKNKLAGLCAELHVAPIQVCGSTFTKWVTCDNSSMFQISQNLVQEM